MSAGAAAPVRFIDRRDGRTAEEQIYGERALRWTYGTTAGRLALVLAVKHAWFSRWFGWRMSRPASRALIAPFIARYGLDPAEFADPPEAFASFNGFFARRLKPEARPVERVPGRVVLPADGRHLCLPQVDAADAFFAKGQRFNLAALLDDPALGRRFAGGALLCSRLCPVDYHRFHFPVDGLAHAPRLVPGALFSVSPVALASRLSYLWENKRMITRIESPDCGDVFMVEIGATCVGSIGQSFQPGREVRRGDEKGWFEFGGSCTITLFEPGRVRFDDDLLAHSRAGLETYARMGEGCATAIA
jgi:phosphatidylserine decarboxylase